MIIYIGFVIVFVGLTCGKKLEHVNVFDKRKSHLAKNTDKSVSFLLFSDVHLDLMYKRTADKSGFCRNESIKSSHTASYGRIGYDTPLNLLQNVLSAMKQKASHSSTMNFILFPGDMSAHRLTLNRRTQMLQIIKRVSKEVQAAFPSIPFFPSIGNNDLPGHYKMPAENDTWYSDLLNIWQDAILCRDCKMNYQTTTLDELRKTFLYGGYYSVAIADEKMTLLVLNSMYWTRSAWQPDYFFTKRANDQMIWLEEQLKLAKKKKRKVLISSHIAPGMDIYSFTSLWMDNFTERYIDLVATRFSGVVAGQVFSHFHRDSFRFLSDKKKDPSFQNSSYILLVPSISPSYRNYPAFRIVHLDPVLQAITDYVQYYSNITREFKNPVWQLDYKFSTRYPPSENDDQVINGKRIKNLSDNLINQSDDSFFNGYISSRQVRYQPDPHYSRFDFYCTITCIKQKEFNGCRKKYSGPTNKNVIK